MSITFRWGENVKMLEDHAQMLTILVYVDRTIRDIGVSEQDGAGVRGFQQIQAAEKGAFSAAAGTNDRDYFAFVNSFRNPFQDFQLSKGFCQIVYLDDGPGFGTDFVFSVHFVSSSIQHKP